MPDAEFCADVRPEEFADADGGWAEAFQADGDSDGDAAGECAGYEASGGGVGAGGLGCSGKEESAEVEGACFGVQFGEDSSLAASSE